MPATHATRCHWTLPRRNGRELDVLVDFEFTPASVNRGHNTYSGPQAVVTRVVTYTSGHDLTRILEREVPNHDLRFRHLDVMGEEIALAHAMVWEPR